MALVKTISQALLLGVPVLVMACMWCYWREKF
jgi:UDP:flavonoid glycosyltransferase YjiC (YdhE family)